MMLLGTPGVGKSTVGRELASRLGLRLVEVTDLAGGEEEVDPRALSARGGSMLTKHGGGVISSHIVFKPRAVNVTRVIVLRRDPLELIEVLRSRGYDEPKVLENVESEFIGVVHWEAIKKFGERLVLQLNVTNRDLNDVVELALRAVDDVSVGEHLDWLEVLDESRLERLLRYLSSARLH